MTGPFYLPTFIIVSVLGLIPFTGLGILFWIDGGSAWWILAAPAIGYFMPFGGMLSAFAMAKGDRS